MPPTFLRLLAVALVSVALVSLVSVVSGQAPDYTLKIDVPFVSVDVTVQDSNGKMINNLPPTAFELYENGVRQEIRAFLPVSTPYNILLLFDRSGSTQNKWPLMQRAVAGFIANLRPQDKIAIAGFDADFRMLLPWTGDRQKALLTLPQLINGSRKGGTDFYGSVDRTLRWEFQKTNGRRALVVLTDGRDTSLYNDIVKRNRVLDPTQDKPFQTAFKTARAQRIPSYFVAFNTDKNLEPNTAGADEYRNLHIIFRNSDVAERYVEGVRRRMEELADVSGGRMLYPQQLEDIVPLYQQIGREMGTSYSLGYVSSNPAADGSLRQITVKTQNTALRLTQSRNGYYAK